MAHRFETVSETTLAAQKKRTGTFDVMRMYLQFFLFYTETNLAICHPVSQIGTYIMSAGVPPGS